MNRIPCERVLMGFMRFENRLIAFQFLTKRTEDPIAFTVTTQDPVRSTIGGDMRGWKNAYSNRTSDKGSRLSHVRFFLFIACFSYFNIPCFLLATN